MQLLWVLMFGCLVFSGLTSPQAFAAPKPGHDGRGIEAITVRATPIRVFHKDGVARRQIGKLIWRGGLVLSSSSKRFGGYSGLEVSSDGQRFLAISDAGTWLQGRLVYRDDRPSGMADTRTGPLLARNSRGLLRGRDRDAESLRLLSGTLDGGRVLIGFEGNQRIGTFPLSGGIPGAPLSYLGPPVRLPLNKGLEAVGVLEAGRYKGSIVAFAERFLDRAGNHQGWLWQGGRRPRPIGLQNIDGFDITDLVGLPDGSLVVLERRFRMLEGVKFRMRLIRADQIAPGRILSGIVLVRADMRYDIDNMEGLAAHRGEHGEIILTLISDDNFNPLLQRTVLLQFQLPAVLLAQR